MGLHDAYNEVIAYFMTQYSIDSPPSRLDDCINTYLSSYYSAEFTSRFISAYLDKLRDTLIEEFNDRFDKNHSLRFRFLDDIGEKIEGIGSQTASEKIEFQNAINELSCSEFESLSAYILKIAGCHLFWKTPDSHDQGIDSFGYHYFLEKGANDWFGASPRLIFLAQAKHFSECKVGSKDIREFVGSCQLAAHRIYSTVGARYPELTIPPFAPVAMIFLTTEEVPLTVKRLALRAGIVVLSSDDLFELILQEWSPKQVSLTKDWILKELRQSISSIPRAK